MTRAREPDREAVGVGRRERELPARQARSGAASSSPTQSASSLGSISVIPRARLLGDRAHASAPANGRSSRRCRRGRSRRTRGRRRRGSARPDASAAKTGKPPAQRTIQCIGTPPSSERRARSSSSSERGCSALEALELAREQPCCALHRAIQAQPGGSGQFKSRPEGADLPGWKRPLLPSRAPRRSRAPSSARCSFATAIWRPSSSSSRSGSTTRRASDSGGSWSSRASCREPSSRALLAEQHDLEFVDVAAIEIDPAAARLLPERLARQYGALPVRFLGSDLILVAVGDPTDIVASDELRMALGRRVAAVADETGLEAATPTSSAPSCATSAARSTAPARRPA